MFCNNCGAALSATQLSCLNCGHQVLPQKPASRRTSSHKLGRFYAGTQVGWIVPLHLHALFLEPALSKHSPHYADWCSGCPAPRLRIVEAGKMGFVLAHCRLHSGTRHPGRVQSRQIPADSGFRAAWFDALLLLEPRARFRMSTDDWS